MALIDELLVGLGFEYDPKEMKQFKDDVGKTTGVIKGLAKAAIAGAVGITGLTIASTRASDEQGKLADEIGDTVENIDALQFALERSGGSADSMAESLRNIAIRASEAARGTGSGVEAFGLLGISASDSNGNLKKASDLMLEVSQRFSGLSKTKQIELADKLGIKDSIRLLQQGPDAIRELTEEAMALGVTTAEDAKLAAEFQDSLTDLWKITKQITRILLREFVPIMRKMADSFTEWWKVNRQLIEQNLPDWIDKATMAIKLLVIATGAWIAMRLVTHIMALVAMFKALSVAAMIANVSALLLPILIASAIAALGLLAEDAKVFFEGGDSFIGDMIEKYPKWNSALTTTAAIFATLSDLTTMIFDGWTGIIDLFRGASIGKFLDLFNPSKSGSLAGFLGDLTGLYTVEGGGLIPEIGNSISNASSTAVDKVEIIIQGGADTAENIASAVMNVFQQTSQDLNTAVDQ
jgi:hypothetical protein